MSPTTTGSTSTPAELPPNHHASHPGFSGLGGLLAGLSMIPRRRGVARLAAERAGVTSARVLAPGGRLPAIERQSHPGASGHASHGWTDGQATAFAERCSQADFEDVRVHAVAAHRRRLWIVEGRRGIASTTS